MVVTTISSQTAGDILAYMSLIKCFSTLDIARDNHYLKLQGGLNQSRYLGKVDHMGIDVLAQQTK